MQEADGMFWMESCAFLAYFTHIECVHYNLKDRKSDARVISYGLDIQQKHDRKTAIEIRQKDDKTKYEKFKKPT